MRIRNYTISDMDIRRGSDGMYRVELDMDMTYNELMALRMMMEDRWGNDVRGYHRYVRPEPEPCVPAFDSGYDPRHYELPITHGHPTVAKDAQLHAAPTSSEPTSTVKLLGR